MKIHHHLNHYIIGAAALALGGMAYHGESVHHNIIVQQPLVGQVQAVEKTRFTWAALSQDKVIALGEALTGAAPGKVVIYCSNLDCHELRKDLDDSFQIANWKSSFEDQHVDSESDAGLFVGPPGPDADNLAKAITDKTGIPVSIVGVDAGDALGVIIGRHEGGYDISIDNKK